MVSFTLVFVGKRFLYHGRIVKVVAETDSALAGRNATISINGIAVTLSAVQRENGDGNSFNLTVYHQGTSYKCYCRTLDAA